MVDAHALGACGCGRAGSNPASPTMEGFWDFVAVLTEGRIRLVE